MSSDPSKNCSKFFDVLEKDCSELNDYSCEIYLQAAYPRELKKHGVTARQVCVAWRLDKDKREAKIRLARPILD